MLPLTQQKPPKTLADHLAIGVAPALIMVLVGSLVYFLALLLYRDGYPMHLYWTLGWFVLGSVLVTRIAIETSPEHSGLFALALGGVTALWLIRYVDPPFGGVALLGLIWWCTRKLVLDCTLIDDDEDASGEGLLDAAGIRELPAINKDSAKLRQPGRLLFRNYATKAAREEALAAEKAAAESRLHRPPTGAAPGAWVLYFSLGALPVFGLGDALMAHVDESRRFLAFALVALYMLAALGLLLTTGFLGFRRYLRQRQLRMPAQIAATWVFTGAILGFSVLLGCVLIPRPHAEFSLPALASRLGDHSLRPAPWKLTQRSSETEPGDKGNGQPNDKAGESRDGRTPPAGNPQEAQDPNSSGKPLNGNGGQSTPSGPKLNDLMAPKYDPVWIKWLVNAFFIGTAAFLVFRYRGQLWAGFCALWHDLLGLFIRHDAGPAPTAPAEPEKPVRPFAKFQNPFVGRRGNQLSHGELVRYTFQALEAWALSHNSGRRADETPLEFATRLRASMPEVAIETHDLACQYTRVAYSGREPETDSLSSLAALWGYMQGHAALGRE